MKEITLQEMLSTIIGELRENGRWGTAHIYQSTLNVFSAGSSSNLVVLLLL